MRDVKRLIFDFDNTLIMWKDEYLKALEIIIEKYNLDVSLLELNYALNNCDEYYNHIDLDKMIKLAKRLCHVEIKKAMLYDWMDLLGEIAIDISSDTKETLAYLSSKYNIVVLSKFLIHCQRIRAMNAGIRHYIDEFYGPGDFHYIKPHPAAFKQAIGNYHKNECIMIGDELENDINGAINFGLQAIFLDNKNIMNENEKYPYLVIKKISDLKNIL